MAGDTEQIATVARAGKGSPMGVGALFQALTTPEWVSLAVVSAEAGSRAWWLVEALEKIAAQRHRPFRALNVLEVTPARATAMAHALSPAKLRATDVPERYLVATDSPLLNPVAMGVIAACDGVVLLVQEARTPIRDARRLIDFIGRDRLIGAVLGSW